MNIFAVVIGVILGKLTCDICEILYKRYKRKTNMKTPHEEIEEIVDEWMADTFTYTDVESILQPAIEKLKKSLKAHTDILKGERRRIIEQLREEVKEELMDEVREGIKAKEKEEDTALYAEFEQRAKVAMENMEKGYFNQGLQTAQEVVEGLLGKK